MSSKRKSPPTKLEGGSQSNDTTKNLHLSNSSDSNSDWTSGDKDKSATKQEKNADAGIDGILSVGESNDTNDHNNNGEDGNDNAGNAIDCSEYFTFSVSISKVQQALYNLFKCHFSSQCPIV